MESRGGTPPPPPRQRDENPRHRQRNAPEQGRDMPSNATVTAIISVRRSADKTEPPMGAPRPPHPRHAMAKPPSGTTARKQEQQRRRDRTCRQFLPHQSIIISAAERTRTRALTTANDATQNPGTKRPRPPSEGPIATRCLRLNREKD